MTKALTIRTDDETLKELERIAAQQDRSRNYVANLALKAYVEGGQTEGRESDTTGYVFEHAADLRSRYWDEDDTEAFLSFLREEREQSLRDDTERGTLDEA